MFKSTDANKPNSSKMITLKIKYVYTTGFRIRFYFAYEG